MKVLSSLASPHLALRAFTMSAAAMMRHAMREDSTRHSSLFAFSPERVLGLKRSAEVRSRRLMRNRERVISRQPESSRNPRPIPKPIQSKNANLPSPTTHTALTVPRGGRWFRALGENPEDRTEDSTWRTRETQSAFCWRRQGENLNRTTRHTMPLPTPNTTFLTR